MGSIYSGVGYLSQATRSARKASRVSGVGSIYSGKSRNHGGIAGGAAYLGSSFLSGLGSIGEGISDLALAGGALLSGNKKYAEYVFKDNTVGNWYSGISESYAPDGVMRFFGDVGQGIGQSSVFLLNAIPGLGQLGTAAFFAGVSSQGISEAASKTGKVSAREVAYGVASGAVEAGLESAFGGVSRLAESIGSGTAKSATRSAVRHGLIRRVLSDAASEFGEEFASEYAETFLQRALQIDPEKEYSLRDALYAGAVGAVSGTVTAGSGEVISAFSNERRGARIIENGNAQTLINTASAFADKVSPTGTDFKRSSEWIRSLRASVSAYEKLGEKQKVGLRGKTMLGEIQASLYFAENQAIFGDVVSEIRNLDVGRRATLAEYVNRTVDPSRRSRDYTAEDIAADTDGIAWQLAVMRYASLCYDIDGALADIAAENEISDAISDVSRTAEASDIDIGGDRRASSDKGSRHGGGDVEISTGKSDGDSHGRTADGGGLESRVKNEAERHAVDRLIAWDKKTSPTAAELNEARGYVKNFDLLSLSRRLAVIRMIRSDSSVSAELRKSVACIMTARDSGGRLLLPNLDVRFDSGIGERGAYVSLGSRSLILLNSSSSLKDTVYSTLAHELVHCVEGRDGYAALAEYAVSTASSAEKERIRSEYEAYYRKKFTDSYRMNGREESAGGTAEDVERLMSSERVRRLIDSEVVARIVGDRLSDGKFLDTYVRRDAGIIRFAYRMIGLIAHSLKGDGGSRTAAALARRLDAALKSEAGVGIGESAVKVKLDVERDETGDDGGSDTPYENVLNGVKDGGSNTSYKENNNDSDSGVDNARAKKTRDTRDTKDTSGEKARAEKTGDNGGVRGERACKTVSFADELRRLALDAEKRSAEKTGKKSQESASQRRASRLSAESARLARALAESVGDGGELISRKADEAAIWASSLIGESDEHALLTLDGDDDRLRSMLYRFISSRGLAIGGESTKESYEKSASSGENANKQFEKSPRGGEEAQNIGKNGIKSGSGVSFSSPIDGETVNVEVGSTDGRTSDTVSDGDLYLSGGEAKLWSDILGGLTCKLRSLTEVYYNGKWVSVAERATVCARGIEEFYGAGSTDGAGNADARSFLKSLGRKINGTYFYSAVTPEAVIEAFEGYAHEGILKSFYRQVREAAQLSDKTRAQLLMPFADVLDSKKPMSDGTLFVWNDGKRKRTYRQKLYEKKVSVSGCTLTLGQGIYLYMLTKRDGARLGIESSGLKIYGEDGTLSVSVPPVSVKAAASELYAQFDSADKAYISLAEDFFNSRAKAIKADADLRAFGYENVIGGYYVPIRRDRLAHGEPVASPRQSFSNAIRISDLEINERTESASCALELSDIQSVIERHARAVADHAHLYLPLKAFDRIYREPVTLGGREVSLRSLISGRVYGKADAYLRALFDDIQGVNRRSGTFLDSVVGKLRGAWVQSVLSANIKVIATQTTSYVAARQVIEEKYLVRALAAVGRDMSTLAARADEYSSLILARSFDMGALRAQGNIDRIGNIGKALGGGIEWTDRRICLLIFHAAEFKAEAEGHGRVGEHENSATAARIADEAIYSTQSMSSNAERSALQRSPSEVARAFTVFTSDSMKQLSHLYSSVMRYLNHKKRAETDSSYASLLSEDRRAVGRSAVTVLATGVSLALITQLFKYLYAKEEDEPEEKVRDAASDLLFSTFGIFPIVSDIAEKWADGYDISLSFFDWLNGTVESFSRLFENAYRAASGERLSSKDIYAPVRDVILDVSVAFGIPAAPIERTVTGLLRRFAPGTLYEYYDGLFYSQSYKSDLAAALKSGDERLASHILSSLYKHGATGSYGLAELSEVSRLYSLGFDALPREARSDGLDAKAAARFEDIYSSASDAVGSLISSKAYGMLDDRARAYAIKSVYSVYYSRALAQATGKELTGFALYSCSVSDASSFFAARAYKKYAAAYTDRFGRRITVREQLLSFLKLLGLSERDRRMIMRANGFKDT